MRLGESLAFTPNFPPTPNFLSHPKLSYIYKLSTFFPNYQLFLNFFLISETKTHPNFVCVCCQRPKVDGKTMSALCTCLSEFRKHASSSLSLTTSTLVSLSLVLSQPQKAGRDPQLLLLLRVYALAQLMLPAFSRLLCYCYSTSIFAQCYPFLKCFFLHSLINRLERSQIDRSIGDGMINLFLLLMSDTIAGKSIDRSSQLSGECRREIFKALHAGQSISSAVMNMKQPAQGYTPNNSQVLHMLRSHFILLSSTRS